MVGLPRSFPDIEQYIYVSASKQKLGLGHHAERSQHTLEILCRVEYIEIEY